MNLLEALAVLARCDKEIKASHRYACGVEHLIEIEEGLYRGFFLSPDYQNGELHAKLLREGFRSGKYEAPYFWRVWHGDVTISYTEGDIAVYVKNYGKA